MQFTKPGVLVVWENGSLTTFDVERTDVPQRKIIEDALEVTDVMIVGGKSCNVAYSNDPTRPRNYMASMMAAILLAWHPHIMGPIHGPFAITGKQCEEESWLSNNTVEELQKLVVFWENSREALNRQWAGELFIS